MEADRDGDGREDEGCEDDMGRDAEDGGGEDEE